MPKITDIQQQKKNKSRYSIFLDGEYAFGVTEDVIIKHRLKSGMEIDQSFIDKVLVAEEFQRTFDSAVVLLSFRVRSEKELRTRLKQKEFAPEMIDRAIAKLKEYKYIDDEAFARMFATDRKNSKKLGSKGVQAELKQKGIDQEIIKEVVSDLCSDEEDLKQAILLCEKKARVLPDKDPAPKRKQKLLQYLIRKGYSFEIAGKAVSTVLAS